MDSQEVSVTIRGRSYRLKSFKDAKYAHKLAKYVDEVMESIEVGTGSRDHLHIMILSLLQITHTYFEAKDNPDSELDGEIDTILKSIEKTEKELEKISSSAK